MSAERTVDVGGADQPMDTTAVPAGQHRRALAAATLDVACVLAFVAVGRRNHHEGASLTGIAETAWPFLTGLAVAWLLGRAWRAPTAVWPTGVGVWLCTVGVGMGLRAATGAGVAISFVLVATAVTAALLLGWRAAFGRRLR